MRLQISILTYGIETRTIFLRIQVPMTDNKGTRIFLMQRLQQLAQGSPLGIRPSVHRLSVLRQPADITNPNRMPIVVLAVCPYHFFGSARFDGSVYRNHIVVPTAFPTQRAVITVNVRKVEGTARPIGGTVQNNQRDGSHRVLPSAPPAAPVISNSTSFTM